MARKLLSMLVLLCVLLVPATAYAHTHLESASPKAEEVIKQELQEITLQFGSPIGELSNFEVIDASNQPVQGLKVTVKDDTMKGQFTESLPNGTYQVNWRILGEDTHVIKGAYSFKVDLPAAATAPANSDPAVAPKKTDSPTLEPSSTVVQNEVPASDLEKLEASKASDASVSKQAVSSAAAQPKEYNRALIYLVIIGGAILVCAVLYFTRRVKLK